MGGLTQIKKQQTQKHYQNSSMFYSFNIKREHFDLINISFYIYFQALNRDFIKAQTVYVNMNKLMNKKKKTPKIIKEKFTNFLCIAVHQLQYLQSGRFYLRPCYSVLTHQTMSCLAQQNIFIPHL